MACFNTFYTKLQEKNAKSNKIVFQRISLRKKFERNETGTIDRNRMTKQMKTIRRKDHITYALDISDQRTKRTNLK